MAYDFAEMRRDDLERRQSKRERRRSVNETEAIPPFYVYDQNEKLVVTESRLDVALRDAWEYNGYVTNANNKRITLRG